MHDLSPDLRNEVSTYLIHDDVRHNPLFEGTPPGFLSNIVSILQTVHAQPNDLVVEAGESGTAMFIIVEGRASKHTPGADGEPDKEEEIGDGESFGEEIVLGFEEQYKYTVVATSRLKLFSIPEALLLDRLATFPDQLAQMRENFQQSGAYRPRSDGKTTLIGGTTGIPYGFAEVLFERLQEESAALERIERSLGGPMQPPAS